MAFAGVLIFLLAFLSVKMGKTPVVNEKKKLAVVTDTVKKDDNTGGSIHLPAPAPVVNHPQEPVHAIVLPQEKNDNAEDDKSTKKDAGKKPVKKELVKKETEAPVLVEKQEKPVPPPVEKKVEKKELRIDDKVAVMVSMRETITKDEDDKERSVSFTVTSPIVYNGVTIINAGAIARGSIRIGRVVSLVSINSVMGANGQEIALNGHDHRKVKKLASDREYRAFVEKGTKMVF